MSEEFDANVPMLDLDPWTASARKLLGLLDTPAYLRRANKVHAAVTQIHKHCESQRQTMLQGVRMRLRAWNQVLATNPAVGDSIAAASFQLSRQMIEELLPPQERFTFAKPGKPMTVWRELVESVRRFNLRWHKFLLSLALDDVNALITDYNRFYVFEKECAFRSARVAGRGFEPIAALNAQSLLEAYPLLNELA